MLHSRERGSAFEIFSVHRREWRQWFPQILEPMVLPLVVRCGGTLAMVLKKWTLGNGENPEQSVMIFYVLWPHYHRNVNLDFFYFENISTLLI